MSNENLQQPTVEFTELVDLEMEQISGGDGGGRRRKVNRRVNRGFGGTGTGGPGIGGPGIGGPGTGGANYGNFKFKGH